MCLPLIWSKYLYKRKQNVKDVRWKHLYCGSGLFYNFSVDFRIFINSIKAKIEAIVCDLLEEDEQLCTIHTHLSANALSFYLNALFITKESNQKHIVEDRSTWFWSMQITQKYTDTHTATNNHFVLRPSFLFVVPGCLCTAPECVQLRNLSLFFHISVGVESCYILDVKKS